MQQQLKLYCHHKLGWLRILIAVAVMMVAQVGQAASGDDHGHSHSHSHDEPNDELSVLDILDHHKLHLLEEAKVLVHAEVSAGSTASHDEHKDDDSLAFGYHLNVSYGQKFFGDKAVVSSIGASLSGEVDSAAEEVAVPGLGVHLKPALTYIQHSKVSLASLGYKNKTFDFGSVLSYFKLGVVTDYDHQDLQLKPDIRFVFEHEFDPLGLVPLFGGSLQFYGSSTHLWSMYAHQITDHDSQDAGGSHVGHHHLPAQPAMTPYFAAAASEPAEIIPASTFVHKASLAVAKVTAGQLISLSFNHQVAQHHIELLPADPPDHAGDQEQDAEDSDHDHHDDHPVDAGLNKPQLFDTSHAGFSIKQHIDLYYEHVEYGLLATLSFYRHPDPTQLSKTETYGWLVSLGYEL